MNLRVKLSAALASALIILVVGAAAWFASGEGRDAAYAVQHTYEVRGDIQRVLRTFVDAETGQRGYLLTRDSAYLTPYLHARTDVNTQLETLRILTIDNAAQTRRIDSLAAITDAKLVELGQTISLAASGHPDSALALVRGGRGRGYTTEARRVVAEMDSTEQLLLAQRTETYKQRRSAVAYITGLGSVIAALLSVLSLIWIRGGVVELEHAKDTIEEQSEELAQQLEESQALTEELASSNDELLQANTAVEDARARFEQIIESTDEGLYGVDTSGTCTFLNQAAAHILGYEREELYGTNMHAKIHSRHADGTAYPAVDCPIYKGLRDGNSIRVAEEVFWRKDGLPIPVEYTSSPIVEDGVVVGAVVAYNDITMRKTAEREREKLISALARSNQELDQFAYVASHDLKAPLRGIANLSQWVEEDLGPAAPPEVLEKMNLLRGRVHRLEALIDGVLQYSRAGRVRATVEDVDVGTLLHEVVELLAPPAETKITIDPGMPTEKTERTPLQQVFMNLIGNAIKYNRKPGATVHVSVEDAGACYRFSIADNGPGIDPEYHERIFGIFQTLESRDRVEGTGIGLTVVKKVVELRGGKIIVHSTLGEGATFTFEWPKTA